MNRPEFNYRFLMEYLETSKYFALIDKYPKNNRSCRKLNFVEKILFG